MSSSLALPRATFGSAWSIDRLGVFLSGLCVVHCIVTALSLGVLASAGDLFSPSLHEYGLIAASLLGAVALTRGILVHGLLTPSAVGGFGLGVMAGALDLPHGGWETAATVLGVGLVALSHELNRRAIP
ncbi:MULTISPECIES: MerC domain-containing protein [unclassified Sphingomonas]|uniref:MerC domain-containing protein n=1 Tax=unclassified Sphingomonas TaxID=196159 RepID=UPI000829509F|nr:MULTISPECIES: MerC domain-containing protein [unclassified Sphingomonas]